MVKFLGGLGDNRVRNVETPTFLPEDNIRFGVEYSPDSRPPVIGRNHTIRSNSIIYNDVVISEQDIMLLFVKILTLEMMF